MAEYYRQLIAAINRTENTLPEESKTKPCVRQSSHVSRCQPPTKALAAVSRGLPNEAGSGIQPDGLRR
ncbi:MAG TPA: hypothetical protein DDW52_12170 [Planctomycetaceae bacterium]|nr:hypothetical protein [Planctomycetaceae bacterium]